MRVTKEYIDSDPDMSKDQFEEWVGAHDSYEFDFGRIKIRATSWAEKPTEVSIGWYEVDGKREMLTNTIINQHEFKKAAKYLKDLKMYEIYRFYNGAYPTIPESVWESCENT